MNREKINLTIEMPKTGFDDPALRRLSGLVAAHKGLSFEKTPEDTLRFDLGERAPHEAQDGAAFIAALCETARNGQTALYCRTAVADPAGIAAQREALERFAGEQGFGNIVCYEDDGYSHRDFSPAFLQLEKDVQSGKIQRVLSEDLFRLGRNTAGLVNWHIWLQKYGANLFTPQRPMGFNVYAKNA